MKNSPQNSQTRLEHILKAIAAIEKYVEGINESTFCENDLVQDAVLMQLL